MNDRATAAEVDDVLSALLRRRPIGAASALVVAHPDDETIGCGATLHLFRNLILIHVTDGAPRDLADAQAAGFATSAGYAAARGAELANALALSGWTGRTVRFGVADQAATEAMPAVADRLASLFAAHEIRLVLTHAFEGGHPDHDATAFAVHCAAKHLDVPPTIVEIAGYHIDADGGMATGRFLPNGSGAVIVSLDEQDQQRKRAMLDCFVTQRSTLAPFGTGTEAFRQAPVYHFTKPPHDGTLHYERYPWGMTGGRWCACAARVAR